MGEAVGRPGDEGLEGVLRVEGDVVGPRARPSAAPERRLAVARTAGARDRARPRVVARRPPCCGRSLPGPGRRSARRSGTGPLCPSCREGRRGRGRGTCPSRRSRTTPLGTASTRVPFATATGRIAENQARQVASDTCERRESEQSFHSCCASVTSSRPSGREVLHTSIHRCGRRGELAGCAGIVQRRRAGLPLALPLGPEHGSCAKLPGPVPAVWWTRVFARQMQRSILAGRLHLLHRPIAASGDTPDVRHRNDETRLR